MKPLSGIDAAFLQLETAETPMHVGAVQLYEPPARGRAGWVDRARAQVAARLPLLPVLRRRLASLPFDVASPVWVEDREVDLDRHFHRVRLARPGTMAQLEARVARLHAERLDRGDPLWSIHAIEGLASGEVALYVKVHHAMLDGVAGVRLAEALHDASPAPRRVRVPPPAPLEETPGLGTLLGAAVAKSAGEYGKLLRSLPDAARLVGDGVAALAALGGPVRGGKGLLRGPPTAFNVAITGERAFATASIPLAEVKAVAKRHGAKVNDVVLAIVGGALRRALVEAGGLPKKPLVAAMPVSLRADGDTAYSTRATLVVASLATHLAHPLARLEAIRDSAGRAKAFTVKAKAVLPVDFPSLGAPWVLSAIARAYGVAQGLRAFPPLANVVVSNVPGPAAPLYLAGARLRAWWPASIVEHGLGLNVTVQSYAGSLDFGIVAARAAMPGVRALAGALYDAHRELTRLRR